MRATTGLLFEAESGRHRFLVTDGTPPIIVGRHPPYEPQNVRVASILVSRRHACIRADARGEVTIEDDASASGLYVDDERFAGARPLHGGERVRIGGERFTTRRVRGHTLYELLCAGERADRAQVAALLRAILAALAPLHATGDAHGNLDWHHVLHEDTGAWITIIDGWTVLGPEGTLSCNPAYCAPEVFAQNVLTPASDVYAAGLLAFEMRTGRRPFEPASQDVNAHMLAKLRGVAPAWGDTDASPAERDLYARLLAVAPAARPAIAEALALVDALA